MTDSPERLLEDELLLTDSPERLLEDELLLTLEEDLPELEVLLDTLVVALPVLEEDSLLTEVEALRADDDVVERRPSIRPVA